MKVLVVGTGGSLSGSGITTAADQMVRTLERMGHEPTRLVAGERRRKRPNRLNLENVAATMSEAVAVARAARRVKVDIVWLHTFGVPTLPAIRTLAQVLAVRAAGRSVIVEFHAFGLADHVASAGALQRVVLRLIARLSRRLVTLTENDADGLRSVVPAREVAVLANWVDVPGKPTPLPPGPPFTALFVGGLVERKGVSQLIDAMRLLDEVPIRLRLAGGAGDDGEAAAAALRHGAADLVQAGRVEFLGHLDAAGVRAELRAAHVFVLPSRAEGMPLSLLEALAEGRSVLVGDAGNMADIVRDSGCGDVLSSTDPGVIADAIRRAVAHPRRLADQGRAGYRAARSAATAGDALERILSASPGPHQPRR